MKSSNLIIIALLVFSVTGINLHAQMDEPEMEENLEMMNETVSPEPVDVGETFENAMIGKVLLIGDNIIRIQEDSTSKTFDIHTKQDMVENVSTGERVAVRTENGELTFIKVLGLHKEAEPIVIYEERSP